MQPLTASALPLQYVSWSIRKTQIELLNGSPLAKLSLKMCSRPAVAAMLHTWYADHDLDDVMCLL
jgi:hypothetical protein